MTVHGNHTRSPGLEGSEKTVVGPSRLSTCRRDTVPSPFSRSLERLSSDHPSPSIRITPGSQDPGGAFWHKPTISLTIYEGPCAIRSLHRVSDTHRPRGVIES